MTSLIKIKDSVVDFNFDLRRTLILSKYVGEWGIPKSRVIARNQDEAPIEVYWFPGEEGQKVARFATMGVSARKKAKGKFLNHELLFVLPTDLGGADEKDIFNYMLDVSVYALRDDVDFGVETSIPESSLAPEKWKLKAVLVDEARGESEVFEKIHVGIQHISLLWLVPIYQNEYRQIREHGIESFDRLCEKSDFSLVDISRPSLVPIQSV